MPRNKYVRFLYNTSSCIFGYLVSVFYCCSLFCSQLKWYLYLRPSAYGTKYTWYFVLVFPRSPTYRSTGGPSPSTCGAWSIFAAVRACGPWARVVTSSFWVSFRSWVGPGSQISSTRPYTLKYNALTVPLKPPSYIFRLPTDERILSRLN